MLLKQKQYVFMAGLRITRWISWLVERRTHCMPNTALFPDGILHTCKFINIFHWNVCHILWFCHLVWKESQEFQKVCTLHKTVYEIVSIVAEQIFYKMLTCTQLGCYITCIHKTIQIFIKLHFQWTSCSWFHDIWTEIMTWIEILWLVAYWRLVKSVIALYNKTLQMQGETCSFNNQ